MEKSKNSQNEADSKKKTNQSQDALINAIQLKSLEKDCLDRVFKMLCELQEQPSSDDDNSQKKYLMEIQKRANQKKMKLNLKIKSQIGNRNSSSSPPKTEKKYKEDEIGKKGEAYNAIDDSAKKIGVKAVRKILKKLNQDVSKDEMQMMIWVKAFLS